MKYYISSNGYRVSTETQPGLTVQTVDCWVDRPEGRKKALELLDLNDNELKKQYAFDRCASLLLHPDRKFWMSLVDEKIRSKDPTAKEIRNGITEFFAMLGYGPFFSVDNNRRHESRESWINRKLKQLTTTKS